MSRSYSRQLRRVITPPRFPAMFCTEVAATRTIGSRTSEYVHQLIGPLAENVSPCPFLEALVPHRG